MAALSSSVFFGSKLGAPTKQLSDYSASKNARRVVAMASGKSKTGRVLIRMISSADTGVFYVTTKNSRNTANKLELLKFDPIANKKVIFREAKIKTSSKSK